MISIGNRIFTEITRADRALVEQFRGLPSSNINDEMNRLFCMHDYIRLLNPAKAGPLLGTAIAKKAGEDKTFALIEDDVSAYAAKHLKTTEKRMDGKSVAVLGSYGEIYG